MGECRHMRLKPSNNFLPIAEFHFMHIKNILTVYILFAATYGAFFWGGYQTLKPTFFLAGLFFSSIVCIWGSMEIRPMSLTLLVSVTLLAATIDEYAHTSAGFFTYFDGLKPSPLTVFGWSLFILVIRTVAMFMRKRIPTETKDGSLLKATPAFVTIVLLVCSMSLQGYLGVIDLPLVAIYLFMSVASIYYTLMHSLEWNISVMVSSLIIGAVMEFMGARESMWFFHFMESIPFFMAFTWTLRTWTILLVSESLSIYIKKWDRTKQHARHHVTSLD